MNIYVETNFVLELTSALFNLGDRFLILPILTS